MDCSTAKCYSSVQDSYPLSPGSHTAHSNQLSYLPQPKWVRRKAWNRRFPQPPNRWLEVGKPNAVCSSSLYNVFFGKGLVEHFHHQPAPWWQRWELLLWVATYCASFHCRKKVLYRGFPSPTCPLMAVMMWVSVSSLCMLYRKKGLL